MALKDAESLAGSYTVSEGPEGSAGPTGRWCSASLHTVNSGGLTLTEEIASPL